MPDVAAPEVVVVDNPVVADVDQLAMDAFDKGLAVANGEEPDTLGNPDDAEIVPDDAAPPAPDDTVPLPDDAEDVDPDATAKAAPAVPEIDIDKEIAERGLKGKTAERFQELANEVKAHRAAFAELGITDIAQVRNITERMTVAEQTASEWQDTVTSTGATPQQFGSALGYLKLINSGDPAQMRQAYDAMAAEQAWLAGKLGLAATGGDPLDADPDLKEQVRLGEVPREVAERLVQQAAQLRLREENVQRTAQATTAEQAQQQGINAISALGNQLRATDGANFTAKLAQIQGMIPLIQQRLPPADWAPAIKDLYEKVVLPQAPVRIKPKIGAMPLRPTGGSGADTVARKPTSDLDAFEMGLEREREMRLGRG